jgi:ABC-type sugar transport system substrate-binding protein
MIVKDMVNPFFIDMKEGGAAACVKYGVDFTCLAPEKYSVELQIRIMEDLVEKQVDGIVLCPIDGAGIVAGVERANKAGIPVMGCNTRILGGETIGFAGIDHVSSGIAMGEYFVDRLGGKGDVIILEGTTGASSSQEMLQGLHQVIDKYPDINVLTSTTAKYNRQMAMQVMEDMLTRFPRIDAVMCLNDSMALGAKEAVAESRRDIMIGGINALPEALEAVKNGELEVTVDSSGYIQGYVATELACKYLLNGEKPPEETKIGVGKAQAIHAGNIDEFLAVRAAAAKK